MLLLRYRLHATPRPAAVAQSSTATTATTAELISSRRRSLAIAWLSSTLVAGLATSASSALQLAPDYDTLSNIPQMLSGACPPSSPNDCRKPRIQRPKSKKAEICTRKCVATCIRGGEGAPGEGPLNVRKPLVVFKQGFHSRQYW